MLYLAEILLAQTGLTVLVGYIRTLGGDLAEALLYLMTSLPKEGAQHPELFQEGT